jgi:hypothetical protein
METLGDSRRHPFDLLDGIVEQFDKDLVTDAEFIQKDDKLSVEESIGESGYLEIRRYRFNKRKPRSNFSAYSLG